MDYGDYQRIRIDVRDRIATATLNRPDQRNAVDERMHRELARLFTDLDRDPAADVIVLTGAGQAFCAGGDAGWMQQMIDDPARFGRTAAEGRQIVLSLLDCRKPVIARLNGHAVGLGATVALFCDVIFAAEHAKLGDPHVRVGLVAGDGGAAIWPHLVGHARAKEYLMTGDLLTATEAERIGLVNHVVPSEDLDAAVGAFARRLADGAT